MKPLETDANLSAMMATWATACPDAGLKNSMPRVFARAGHLAAVPNAVWCSATRLSVVLLTYCHAHPLRQH